MRHEAETRVHSNRGQSFRLARTFYRTCPFAIGATALHHFHYRTAPHRAAPHGAPAKCAAAWPHRLPTLLDFRATASSLYSLTLPTGASSFFFSSSSGVVVVGLTDKRARFSVIS